MKIRLSVHQKAGAPDFGSDGIGAEMEIDLDQAILATPDAVRDCFRSHYAILKAIVADELAALHRQRTPARSVDPEPERPARRPEPSRDRNGDGRESDRNGRSYGDDAPRDGRQLLAWARKNDASDDVMRIGRNWKLPPRVIQWERSEVEDVYRELLAMPVGGGRRSG